MIEILAKLWVKLTVFEKIESSFNQMNMFSRPLNFYPYICSSRHVVQIRESNSQMKSIGWQRLLLEPGLFNTH